LCYDVVGVVQMIDLASLPQEIRDVIELREQTDPTFWRFTEFDYTDIFWSILRERADPGVEHSIIMSITGSQGSGKSLSTISMCCFMDPTFTHERIFFNYNDLVKERIKLKPNTAVLLDEQSQTYGLDAHRVMVILSNIKEQLRKKSIHLFFCSPVLYEESKTSMYLLEIIFVDKKEQEAYGAFKTREGLTLGHVRIPHPLKLLSDGKSLASKELIDAYQWRKDEHLEVVLGQRDKDEFEERAKLVMQNALFQKAEKIYKRQFGYIPQNTVIQIINKLYPEYHAGVVPYEIAGRIKLDRELSGEWMVPGRGKRRSK
jgi:hypothetical protein